MSEDDKCPESVLTDMDSTMLNKWLAVFMAETRKVNGEAYQQLSSHCCLEYNVTCAPLILIKLQISSKRKILHLKSCTPPWILYTKKKFRSDGVGAEKHSAVPFSKMEENELWEQGVIGKDSPTALLRAVFFL